jgi:hypothetical protein
MVLSIVFHTYIYILSFSNAVVPVWSAETSHHTSRGMMLALEFTANIFGVVVAVSSLWMHTHDIFLTCSLYSTGLHMVWLIQKVALDGDSLLHFN